MLEQEVKLQKHTSGGTISLTLPKAIASALAVSPGDKVEVSYDVDSKQANIKKVD
jgi:antitoxin component of MazEF toxin-antitoxin module